MSTFHRREFLADVGRGMLVAGFGPALACDLGLVPQAFGADATDRLSFGKLEPLVALLQQTPPTQLMPQLVGRLNQGTDLRTLTAAAAFANARTFGGEDYFGFHVFMALAPAYQMAAELPADRQALPLLKVLYRNAFYTEKVGGPAHQTLGAIQPVDRGVGGEQVRQAVDHGDGATAERRLAAMTTPEDALNAALLGVEDNHDVHTIVMPWRAWALLDVVGRDQAVTLLRQSVRQCAKRCTNGNPEALATARAVVPNLIDKHRLLAAPDVHRRADDAWIARMCELVLTGGETQAGEAIAAALAEGISPTDIGEAISLAANQLVLRQVENWGGNSYGRRCHGDSPGVHASDATNAWRNIIKVCNARNRAAGLILAAMNVAHSYTWSRDSKPTGMEEKPFPHPEHLESVPAAPDAILKQLEGAIRENDQIRASALVHRYGAAGAPARPVFDLLLRYAVSEDGRLHGEKYYRTVTEEFATTRPAFRWRQLVGLARVTASAYGYNQADKKEGRAPGYEEACRLLRVS